MKRKTPPTPAPQRFKRRRLSSPFAENELNESEEMISPLTDVSIRLNKISPRPTILLAKQLQSKRIMTKKKKINLTDDESNIIHEGEEGDEQHDFDDAEAEIARGKQTQNKNEYDMDLDEDPFAITNDSDIVKTKNTNKNQEDEFQTVSEVRNVNKESESEMYLDQELEISEILLSQHQKQKQNIEIEDNENDNESMNMSLQIQIESDKNLNIPIANKQDIIERSIAIEEDEKAFELNDDTSTILSHTISQINDNQTLFEIQENIVPTKKTYSVGKRTKKTVSKQKQAIPNVLTPITMRLHERLNKRIIATTTKSRRKKRNRIEILPSEVELIDERMRRRSHSLFDEFKKKQMDEYNEDIEDNDINEKKDEIRQMILNQSGLSQQWDLIENERKKKQRQTRKRLTKKNKKKKQKRRMDCDFGVVRPVMSEAIADEYKEKETKLADFWREIEAKMENDEFGEHVKIVNNENEINIRGKRAKTPPRIEKHLERRYRKQYENMSNEVVDTGRKKGKKVWFLGQKTDVLNERQDKILENENNNSLISVSEMSDEEMMDLQDIEDEMGVFAVEDMSLHSIPVVSVGISLMDADIIEKSELSDVESVSVVSGMLLPSIGELSSIMEGIEEEAEDDDMAMVDDPFNVNNDNNMDDDGSQQLLQ